MNQSQLKAIGWFSIGMATGLAVANVIFDYKFVKPVDSDSEDETVVTENALESPSEGSKREDNGKAGLVTQSSISEFGNYVVNGARVKYSGYFDADDEDDDEYTEEDPEDYNPRPNAINDISDKDHPLDDDEEQKGIHLIDQEMFDEVLPGRDRICLVYYAEDDVLTDETDMIVDNVETVLGKEGAAILNDNTPSTLPDIFWVRNYDMGADYEVTIDSRSYEEVVLGIGSDDERHGLRKMKDYDG